MTTQVPRKVKETIKKFETVRADMISYMDAHETIFHQFLAMASEYNGAFDAAKDAMKSLDTTEQISVGPFLRKAASIRVKYDPTKLPDEILLHAGVVKEVDRKRIQELLEAGEVYAADVLPARTETVGTAAITGPKRIEFSP